METDSLSSEEENDWEDDDKGGKESRLFSWMDSGNTSYVKEKLVQILEGEVLIPKQRWSLCKILATLVFHWNDLHLCSAFRQF